MSTPIPNFQSMLVKELRAHLTTSGATASSLRGVKKDGLVKMCIERHIAANSIGSSGGGGLVSGLTSLFTMGTTKEKPSPKRKKASPAKKPPAKKVPKLNGADAIFTNYADHETSTTLNMDNIIKLGGDCSVDPEDLCWMVFLWKLARAGKTKNVPPGEIAKADFLAGMAEMKLKSIADIKKSVPSHDVGFLSDEFPDFYKFFFKFNLEGTHTTLEAEVAIDALKAVLVSRNNNHLDQFCDFIDLHKEGSTRVVSLDQWSSFLPFSATNPSHCKGYHEAEDNIAWPSMIDEYADWVMDGMKGRA